MHEIQLRSSRRGGRGQRRHLLGLEALLEVVEEEARGAAHRRQVVARDEDPHLHQRRDAPARWQVRASRVRPSGRSGLEEESGRGAV